MKAHELFRHLSAGEVQQVVVRACEDDGVPDKIAGAVLTFQNIPLRRFAKLPEETRRALVRRTLRDKRAAELSLYVLSAALVRTRASLIETFLDAAGLPHDGPNLSFEGAIPEPPAERVGAAIDASLAGFDARDVSLYLHAFAAQPDVKWPSLDARLASDERLRLEDRSAA
jgi:hypothetical protein